MGYGISYDSGGSRCDLRHLVFRQYKHTGDSGIADRGLVIADDASAWTQNLEDRSGRAGNQNSGIQRADNIRKCGKL